MRSSGIDGLRGGSGVDGSVVDGWFELKPGIFARLLYRA